MGLVGVGAFVWFSKEVGFSLPLDVKSFADNESLFRRKLHAAQTTLIVRLYEICENLGCCFSAFDDHAVRQIELIICSFRLRQYRIKFFVEYSRLRVFDFMP